MINWNVDFEGREDIYKLMVGDIDPSELKDMEDAFDHSKSKPNKWNKDEPVVQKFFVDFKKQGKTIMIDFEEFMLKARRGGIYSGLRPKAEQGENEEIRGRMVQEYLESIPDEIGKNVWAIPINTSWTSESDIWEQVKNTRMHEIDSDECEFTLTVMIKPYSCNIFSIWIYVCVYTPKDDDA